MPPMNRNILVIVAVSAALLASGCGLTPSTTITPSHGEQSTDIQAIRVSLDEWIAGWSPGDRAWTGEELRPLYAPGPNAIRVFDNVEGDVVELRSFEAYQDEWMPMMAPMRGWAIKLAGPAEISVSGDMAYATFIFDGGEDPSNANAFKLRQYGTLVWERRGSSSTIVHEHLTADTVR